MRMMKYSVLLSLFAFWSVTLHSSAWSAPLPGGEVASATVLSRMVAVFTNAKAFDVVASTTVEGKSYRIDATKAPGKSREAIYAISTDPESGRKTPLLVYAGAQFDGRVQEFVPTYTFSNKQTGTNVLVEFAQDSDEDWSRLTEHDFSCKVGGKLAGEWISPNKLTTPMMMRDMSSGARMTVENRNGNKEYVFSTTRDTDLGSRGYELRIDAKTFRPTRETHTFVQGGQTTVESVDYQFTFRSSAEGIAWALDRDALAKASVTH